MNSSVIVKESVSGVKLSSVILNNEIVYMVSFPLLPDELVSSKNERIFRNYEEVKSCYEAFIRGYEYAKAN